MLWILGGNVNLDNCYHYYLEPTMDFPRHWMKYKNGQNPPLQVKTPATGKIHEIARIPPNCAPDSNVDEQIHTVLLKIETFLGKHETADGNQRHDGKP
jgi:hypothetical protein